MSRRNLLFGLLAVATMGGARPANRISAARPAAPARLPARVRVKFGARVRDPARSGR